MESIKLNLRGDSPSQEPLVKLLGDEKLVEELTSEADRAIDTNNYPISAFKIQQKIIDIKNKGSLDVGRFVNGNSDIKKFVTRYEVVLFSNRFDTLTDPQGHKIRKRYGYGFGFTLEVSDIKTKLSFNFRIIAASAALQLARAQYALNVNGLTTGELAGALPANTGDFSSNTYTELQKFIDAAKAHLSSQPINQLYPIEVLRQGKMSPESDDIRSIYFGVTKLSEGLKLNDAIKAARAVQPENINENVIQFIYNYFDVSDAYTEPTGNSRRNASKWLKGSYNKVQEWSSNENTWVAIDPAIENGRFVVLSGLDGAADFYQPHPLPANWADMPKALDDTFSFVSTDFSSSLKLSSIIDISGKFNTINITRDICFYADVSSNPVPGSKVIETRYGVGLRLTLRISQVEFGTTINYANIGAASQLGHAFVEYEIAGLGVSDPNLLKEFPGPREINEESMASINAAFNNLKNKIAELPTSKMQPQPFMIRVNEPDKVDPTLKAQAYVFGMRKLADKARLRTAMKEAEALGIKKEVMQAIYKERCNITSEEDKPSNDQKNKAEKWLSV